MALNKNTKIILNYSIGLVILLLTGWNVFGEVKKQWLSGAFDIKHLLIWSQYLSISFVFAALNIITDIFKWQYVVSLSQKVSFRIAARSYFAGMCGGLITPNRLGEFPARISMLPQPKNAELISLSTFTASIQILVSLLFGIIGLQFLANHTNIKIGFIINLFNYASIVLLLILVFKYNWFQKRILKWRWISRWFKLPERNIELTFLQKIIIVAITVLKYLFYLIQFYFILLHFGVDLKFVNYFIAANAYFWALTVIPSISIGEIGIRGQLSILIFGVLSQNLIGILLAAFFIWMLNLILPALPGAVFLSRKKWIK